MDVVRLYDRVLPECTTVNQVNRLLIRLDNRMTPREADRLIGHVLAQRPRRLRVALPRRRRPLLVSDGSSSVDARDVAAEWAERSRQHLSFGLSPGDLASTRVLTGTGAALYQASSQPSDILVIGFTGHMQRLMLPTPLLLQQLAPFAADVLLLSSRPGAAFRTGVPGASDDLPSTVRWLDRVIHSRGAQTAVAMGTSAGAFPAILAAYALGLPAVLAAGTRVSDAGSYWPGVPADGIDAVVGAAARQAAAPAVHLAFGAQATTDQADSEAVAAVLPTARLVPVAEAGHGCLMPLVQRGEMEQTLASTLFAGIRRTTA